MTATSKPLLERRDVAVLVPAAGQGLRLGGDIPKAFRDLDGRSLLFHCLQGLTVAPSVGLVVIAVPADFIETVRAQAPGAVVVEGGSTRQESVSNALAAVPTEFGIILVHDAARALTPPSLIEAVAEAVRAGHDAVIPVLPVVDTIKQLSADGHVISTVDRSTLGAVQTPQGFRRDVLVKAHASATDSHTDDAGLVERLGLPVFTVPGHPEALKITTPTDLMIAEAILRTRPTPHPH